MVNVECSERTAKHIKTELNECPPISRQEEETLFAIYASTKDPAVRRGIQTKILKSNYRFVYRLASEYNKMTGLGVDDLFSEGKLGMIEALSKYNPGRGIKFISFAIWEIRRHMELYVSNSDLVRIPVLTRKKAIGIKRTGRSAEYGSHVYMAMSALQQPDSLDTPVGEAEDERISDLIPADNDYLTIQRDNNMNDVVALEMRRLLNPDERNVINGTFSLSGCDGELSKVKDYSAISKTRIREIKAAALAKLRHSGPLLELDDSGKEG